MSFRPVSSRRRFAEYKEELRRQREAGTPAPARHNGAARSPDQPALSSPPPSSARHSCSFPSSSFRTKGKRSGTTRARGHRSFFELLRCFLVLLRGHRGAIVFALGTLTVASLLKLLPPAATKVAVDYVFLNEPLPEELAGRITLPDHRRVLLVGVVAAVVVISLLEVGLHLWGRWHATRASKRIQVELRRRAFEHAVRLPLHRVYQLKSGGVASILREDAGGIADLVFSLLYNPWRAIVQLVGGLAVLALVDWRLLLGSLVLLPMVYFTHRTWISRIRPLWRNVRMQRQEIDSHATEAFGGMRVVRGFGRERAEAGRFTRGNHLMARQELHAWWWTRSIEIVWAILIPLASAALLLYGGLRVLEGALTVGDLTMFLVYLAMLLEPIAVLANSASQFQNNLAGLDRVLDLLAEPPEQTASSVGLPVRRDSVAGAIALRGVRFRYPGTEKPVLRDVNLDVRPGEIVALVGPSGAGKTTLCNLVARFYDPSEGAVLLDGIDLRDVDLAGYRSLLGIVEQDVFLFDGTVAENIAYANRDATPDDIRHAAEVANAQQFIMELQDGYDTLIGERGVLLSGGQRQRIALARAVLADPRILILDEATSNLDTESERLIQQSLAEVMRGRTCFVIAHRLSTIAHAHHIVVLEEGAVVEEGTHDELMATSGRYRHMVELQTHQPSEPEDAAPLSLPHPK